MSESKSEQVTLTTDLLRGQKVHRQKVVVPRFVYLGAGCKNKSIDTWLHLQSEVSRYVDPVAGSCNQPYAVGAKYGVPVWVNDASYYSFCIGGGLFHRESDTDLEQVAQVLVDATDNLVEGFFVEAKVLAKTMPVGVARYIDGLICLVDSRFSKPDACFVKACIGKSLISLYSLRAMTFALPRGLDSKGKRPSVETFAVDVYRTAVLKNSYHLSGGACWSCAKDFLEWVDLTDTTVSIDPAWPFSDKTLAKYNPYNFYFLLGEILKQTRLKPFAFWEDEQPDKVLEEFAGWVQVCFDRGAREVYVWNQTTNAPSKEQFTEGLSRCFTCEEALSVSRGSTHHKYVFTDYCFRLTR